jgi:superfamily II DNA helicase RecQ
MIYRLFQYMLPTVPELEDLNSFLRAQRVAAATHHLVPVAGGTMLVFVVETVGPVAGGPDLKIDYRERFNPEEFAVFSRLREERKKWAAEEGTPVYVVFTNAQLAEMVTRRARSGAELRQIEGVGEARLQKYGARLVELLAGLGRVDANAPPVPTSEGDA